MFKELENKPNFPELEKKIADFWKENNILEKYLKKNKDASMCFSFLDGPITANNPMGVHHARGRTLKDLYQRFKNMQGYEQRFQNGFDCQGLWVEVEVEKKLGFNSKKDIEKFGLDKFTQACIDRVDKYAGIQTEQSRRLGYFMDWENSYYTMSENNNLYIWAFLKKCNEKGLVYKNKSSTVWCPRCETGLSKHEQADGYMDITDISVYVKFKIKSRENEYFLAWTTTPWTLSANILLAVNPKYQYVKTNVNGEVFYLAQESADRLGLKDYSLVKAKDLLGLEYEPVYNIPAQEGIKHFVVEWEEVNPQEGTGIVHIAPGCGEEDFVLGQKHKAPILSPLDETGRFGHGYGELTGKYAHDVAEQVLEYLKQKNLFYKTENITHSYPHCWRCGTKCLFRVEDNWFINLQGIKPNLKKAAKKANWIPEYVGKRMQNWLDNMADWMISRKRFYGLSLPFYECGVCGKLTVIGSKQELRERAVAPDIVDKLPRLHRPWIDEIEIKCPKCGKHVKRILDVGDCWLDAGVIPFSTLKYFEDKKYWQKWFPAELVSEMTEQVRLWYYSMLVYGVVFENKIPYLNVLNYDEVRDENGERMSKTKGNGIPFDEAVEKMGADVIRWVYARRNPKMTVNFGYGPADEIKKQFLLVLWNCYKFFINYACLEFKTDEEIEGLKLRKSKNILDKWIFSRLNKLIGLVTEKLENYDNASAVLVLEDFVLNDFSTWYIRRSRNRVGPSTPLRAGLSNEVAEDKKDCYATMFQVLLSLTKLMAPIIPFTTEKFWQALGQGESAHLQDWPRIDEELIDEKLEERMAIVREICSLGHAIRKEKNIGVRQALGLLEFSIVKGFPNKEKLAGFFNLIEEEVNVEQVVMADSIEKKEGFITKEKEGISVALDMRITDDLKEKNVIRETISRGRKMRGEAECKRIDRIIVWGVTGSAVRSIWEKNREDIVDRLGAKELILFDKEEDFVEVLKSAPNVYTAEFNVLGEETRLALKRIKEGVEEK